MNSHGTKSKATGRSGTRAAEGRSAGRKSSASKSKGKAIRAKSKTASPKAANKNGGERLSPGRLNDLVLGYMKKHRSKLPASAGTVGRGIRRSSGAVANCLGRLENAGEVKLTNKKPREYDLVGKNGK
jgi:hypothetical protein